MHQRKLYLVYLVPDVIIQFFLPKTNSRTKKVDLLFHDFGLGFWDLGFRIWGSGSVTWDSGFGIQDLGLRIWYLDSSWPTDPFDQLDVAQLSQIFSNFFTQAPIYFLNATSQKPLFLLSVLWNGKSCCWYIYENSIESWRKIIKKLHKPTFILIKRFR